MAGNFWDLLQWYNMADKITIYSSLGVSKADAYNFTYSGIHMGERKLTVEVESPTAINFVVGDYAYLNLEHTDEKFYLHTVPIGNRVHNSLMIKYNLTFWWRGYELKTIAFLDYVDGTESADAYNRNTGEVAVNGTIVQLMDRIIANMNRAYNDGWYGSWQYDIHASVDVDPIKDIVLTNQYCWDAVLLIYSLFGIEYRIDFDARIILVGYPPLFVEYDGTAVDFEFGKDKGLCEITRLENTEQLITRVFAYGSTRNITPNYRTGLYGHGYSPRLMLPAALCPDGYLANTALETALGRIQEGFYINDEIFPSITGLDNTVKRVDPIIDKPEDARPQYYIEVITPAVSQKVWDEATNQYIRVVITPAVTRQVYVPTQDYNTFTIYIDGTLPNITNEDIQAGLTAKLSFTSGMLTGEEFEIVSYEKYMTDVDGTPQWNDGFGNEYYRVVLKKINNDDNYILPNDTIKPVAGDTFVLLDIFLPSEYESAAEIALYNDTVAWLENHSGAPLAYSIRIPEEYVKKYSNIQYYLREGVTAMITDSILGVDSVSYMIQNITIDWKASAQLPVFNLTLSDKPIKSRIQQLEADLKNANYTINANKSVLNSKITSIEKSAYITNNKIFNSNGDINGYIISNFSIYPTALGTELRSSRYILTAYLQVNYGNDANSAYGSAGVLIHKDSDIVWGGIFDEEHKTWTISTPQTFTELDPDTTYWVYIKGSLIDGSATWLLSETKMLPEDIVDYFLFEWGQILPVIGDVRYSQYNYGRNGASAYVYIGYASDDTGTDFTLTPNPALEYIAILSTIIPLDPPVVSDFDGLWFNRKGADGAPGTPGDDGVSTYTYVAYASDNTGTGWSLTATDLLKYRAEIHSTTVLTPVEADFTGATWVKYLGDDGSGGADVVSGLGMDFITNEAVDLGLPSEINGQTENALTETSHTHKLGNVPLDNVVSGSPVEYGALYNWWAATDARKITSSDDWVVSSNAQYNTLITYLGGSTIAGYHVKINDGSWENSLQDNSSGFNAKVSGYRDGYTGIFNNPAWRAWPNDEYSATHGYWAYLEDSGDEIYNEFSVLYAGSGTVKSAGSSLRLLYVGAGTPTEYIGNNGIKYESIQIGSQFWINCNLNETKYRNGDWIIGYDGGTYTPISNAAWAALTTEAMCYYSDNEAYGGGETPLETLLHPPVTINPASAAYASIDENQVLTIEPPAADNSVEIYIDFIDTTEFVFTAPYAMKFTSQTAESGSATLSPVLDTDLAQYDDVTITPAAAGLVTLTGVKL